MITWDNLLDGWNPALDMTNNWDFMEYLSTIIASPNVANNSFYKSVLILPLRVFSMEFGDIFSSIFYIMTFYVFPIISGGALLFLMLYYVARFLTKPFRPRS